jgi:hypothetical protein
MLNITKDLSLRVVFVCLLSACNFNGAQSADGYNDAAQFNLTTEVVNPGLVPFTATIGGAGNTFINKGSGFEPLVYRNKYTALIGSPDRVYVEQNSLSYWDGLREGVLDGADVQVYRIENGEFRLVREDKITGGGFHVSGWFSQMKSNMIVPAGANSFIYKWATYNRPGVNDYFTVRAIDNNGNLSVTAAEFSIQRPNTLVSSSDATTQVAFTASKLVVDATPPPAPSNLRGQIGPNGTLLLEWDPVMVNDLAGYIVYRSDYPEEAHKGFYIQLSPPATVSQNIMAGDMIFVNKKFYAPTRNGFLSNRVWGATANYSPLTLGVIPFFGDENTGKSWELVPHDANSPVTEAGETYLKLNLADGKNDAVMFYNHSGTGQDWYDVLELTTYKVEVWMRQEGAGKARFNIVGFYGQGGLGFSPIEFNVDSTWRKYEVTFTPTAVYTGATPNQMRLEFTGPSTFHVDNFRVYRADSGYMDLPTRDYGQIVQSGMKALRTHGTIKTGMWSYDMDQFTNPGGVVNGTVKLNTLPQSLMIMKTLGVRPWLQVEFHMRPEEWRGFVEYMAAPYVPGVDTPKSKPWAYKRYMQGQAKPWVEEFDKIYFEVGNETWNGLFRPWVFDNMKDAVTGTQWLSGQVYGKFQEFIISNMKASPYWAPAKLDGKFMFVLGGWSGQNYGRDAAASSPSSHLMTIAAYNGGWDEAEGPPALNSPSLFNVLNQVSQVAIPRADRHAKEVLDLNVGRSVKLGLGTYEAGPGYALNGLNGATVTALQDSEQESVMKSLAAGTATLDSFLARAYRGFGVQNFFTFSSGAHWTSHAKWYMGGQAYPSWKILELFNKQATGDMLKMDTVTAPVIDLPASSTRPAVANAPLVAAYATRQGARYNIFVVSRKIPNYPYAGDDGFSAVTINLPFNKATSVTLYKMTGDPFSNNTQADNVKIDVVNLSPAMVQNQLVLNTNSGADARGFPPASTYLYVFEGTSNITTTTTTKAPRRVK